MSNAELDREGFGLGEGGRNGRWDGREGGRSLHTPGRLELTRSVKPLVHKGTPTGLTSTIESMEGQVVGG